MAKWDKSQPGNSQPSSLFGTCLTLPNLGFLWVFFKYPKISKNGNPLFFPVGCCKMLAVLSGETRGKVEVCKGWLGGDGWWKQFQMKTIVIDSMCKSFCTHFSDIISEWNPHWFSPEIDQIFHDKYILNKNTFQVEIQPISCL